jgi:GGDEF domain-containing protein
MEALSICSSHQVDIMILDMIQKADNALHTAKFNGKNRVCSTAELLSDQPTLN